MTEPNTGAAGGAASDDLVHDPDRRQFRLNVEGSIAFVDYILRDGQYLLVHSEVPVALRGKGAGQRLVEKTFEYLEAHQWPAVAQCPYIQAVARRSPHWRERIGGL